MIYAFSYKLCGLKRRPNPGSPGLIAAGRLFAAAWTGQTPAGGDAAEDLLDILDQNQRANKWRPLGRRCLLLGVLTVEQIRTETYASRALPHGSSKIRQESLKSFTGLGLE